MADPIALESFHQALGHQRAGRLREAEQLYRAVLSSAPRHREALFNLAGALFQLQQLDEALLRVEQAIAADPQDADTYNLKGIILGAVKRPEEAAAALRQAIALNPRFADAQNNLGLILKTLGHDQEAVAALEAATALAPRLSQPHKHLGDLWLKQERHAEALASYERAIALDPNFEDAVNARGAVLFALRRFDAAAASFARVIELNPRASAAYLNQGLAQSKAGRFEDALATFDRAIALQPDYAAAHYSRGVALSDLGRPVDACAAFDRAIAIQDHFPEARFARSLSAMTLGNLTEGLADFEWRKQLKTPFGARPEIAQILTDPDAVAGRKVFVYCEQGLGDSIHFVRYAKLLADRGAQVTLAMPKSLHRLLGTLSPDIEIIGHDSTPLFFGFQSALMSLPRVFGATLDTIPADTAYLRADPEVAARWASRLPANGKLKVGVCWKANPDAEESLARRSMTLRDMLSLAGPNVELVSLQKSCTAEELAELAARVGVHAFDDEIADFADTAALMAGLDLVISVDTSVAHLAGALGKPTWLLLSYVSDWRWFLNRDASPWYPTMRLFRQARRQDWAPVLAEVARDLAALAQAPVGSA